MVQLDSGLGLYVLALHPLHVVEFSLSLNVPAAQGVGLGHMDRPEEKLVSTDW
jgi:hypothetical protein